MINVPINIIRRALLLFGLTFTATIAGAKDVDNETELLEALQGETNITLTSDIALTSMITISRSTPVTLDLNGHNLTANGFRAFHITQGTVTMTSSAPATISANGGIGHTSSVIRVGDNSGDPRTVAFTLDENVTISSSVCYGVTVFGNQTKETVDIRGKIATVAMPAIGGNGSAGYGGTIINIDENAVLTTTNELAIYHPQVGTLTVNGSVTGAGGIEMKAGSLIVGPTATIRATGSFSQNPSTSGSSTLGYAIAIVENAEYSGVETVKISKDATIEGSVACLTDSKHDEVPPADFSESEVQMSVKVVAVGGETNQYLSLEDAFRDATAGCTITLLEDCDLASTIATTQDFTLDLDGHNLTSDGQRAFEIQSGVVTITSTAVNGMIIVPTLANHDSSAIHVGSDATNAVSVTVAENVTITSDEGYGITIAGKNTPQTLNVAGKVATKILPAIAGDNGAEQAATTIMIEESAIITTTTEVAIYQPQTGSLTIDGSVTGASGVEVKGGSLSVGEDAKIIASGTPSHVANDSGTSSRGYSIAIVENNVVNSAGVTAVSVNNSASLDGPVAQLQDSHVTDFDPTYTGNAVNKLVAAIGTDKYFTLKDAVDIVPSSGTVTLLDDLSLAQTLVMDKEKTSTLNLLGHTLTGNNCTAISITQGHVTLEGTVPCAVTVSGAPEAAIQVGDDDGSNRSVSLTVNANVTITSPVSTAILLAGSKTRETLEVSGTVTASNHNAIVATDEIERIHVASGATVSASDAVAIYQANSGELVVEGTVSGTGTTAGAIEMKGGNLTVASGASITATGTPEHTASNVAPSTNAYAIALVENANFPGVGKANISNAATINGVVACLVDSKNINAADPLLTGEIIMIAETPNAADLGEKYAKLSDAINVAIAGKEVKLLDDLATVETITLAKAITLNMDDYSITGNQSSGATIAVDANVIIKNGEITTTHEGISIISGTVGFQQTTLSSTGVGLAIIGGTVTTDNASTFTSTAANAVAISAGSLNLGGKAYSSSSASGIHAIAGTGTATLTVADKSVVSSTNGNGIDWNSTGILNVDGGKISGTEAVKATNGTMTISAGTFTGSHNALNIGASCTPTVTGGTFICGSDVAYQPVIAASATKFVSGDFFSKKIPQSLCANGYMVSSNPKSNGMYYLVDEIVINDGTSWSVPDEKYVIGTARYVRNSGMGAGGTQFGTLCLPFSFSATQTGMTFYAVQSVVDDVLNLTPYTGDSNIPAGTPVVFKFESSTTNFSIESHDATISDADADADEAKNLVGTFATQKLTTGLNALYFLNGDAFHQATSTLTVPAFRAYIKFASPSNHRVLYIHTDDEVVTDVANVEQTDEVESIYDLQGRQQSGLKMGMNVIKMKDGRTIKVHIKN